ncbi:MAG: Spy/CpxP family protein refolding chaperone [Desulfococcaceae bacterium]
MKQKIYQVSLVVVMAAFVSAVFFASANLSFAGAGKKKSAVRTTAVEYTESQIKQLQDSLNITEDQKEPWNNLTHVMRENAKDMDALNKDRDEKNKSMNAVERMKFHSQITETHLAQMKTFIPSFEAFYGSLSDDQKNTVDTTFRTGKHGKHKRK